MAVPDIIELDGRIVRIDERYKDSSGHARFHKTDITSHYKWGFADDGGFVVASTVSRWAAYAYPGSSLATMAKKRPAKAAARMAVAESAELRLVVPAAPALVKNSHIAEQWERLRSKVNWVKTRLQIVNYHSCWDAESYTRVQVIAEGEPDLIDVLKAEQAAELGIPVEELESTHPKFAERNAISVIDDISIFEGDIIEPGAGLEPLRSTGFASRR